MIKLEWFYWLIAAFFLGIGAMVLQDRPIARRTTSALFWALLGACFAYSSFVAAKTAPAWPLGLAVIAIACIAGSGLLQHGTAEKMTDPQERSRLADRFGNKLFLAGSTASCISSPPSAPVCGVGSCTSRTPTSRC